MSLLMEALKKAEAAKSEVPPPRLAEKSGDQLPANNIHLALTVIETPSSIDEQLQIEQIDTEPTSDLDELEEIRDEVNAWQQQLLAEATERDHFLAEESEEKYIAIAADDSSPLAEMLATELSKPLDWEAGILPEFQKILATEPTDELIVLEDTQSTLHWEVEPSVPPENDSLEVVNSAPTLSFSREIVPDLSLMQVTKPESHSHLKLDWDDDILATTAPVTPIYEPISSTTPSKSGEFTPAPTVKNSAISQEKQSSQQRDEAKRLFKASSHRTSNYRWAYIALLIVGFVSFLGTYGIQHQDVLTHYLALFNEQFTGTNLVVNLPPPEKHPLPTPATHPVESTVIIPVVSDKKLPPPPAPTPNVTPPAPPPVPVKVPNLQPTELKPTVTASAETGRALPPATTPSPLADIPKPVKKPNSPPVSPKTPDNVVATMQLSQNKDIQIKHSTLKPRMHQNLTQAYAAFQRGENKTALSAYQTVLQQEPRNRDALLGLAAIAVRQQRYPQATRYYQDVLKYYPQDPVAQTNLLSISKQLGGEDREIQLQNLARTAQQPAYIYFQLGVVYAQQNRWNDAQQAFFEASRIDSQNADYSYNLAVSLEHLHQPQVAITYYQRAVQLQQKQGKFHSFEPNVVQRRIAALRATTGSVAETTNLMNLD